MKMAKNKILEWLVVIGLLAASAAVYGIYLAPRAVPTTVQAQSKPTYLTSPVTTGDIANTATGSGSLVSSLSASLGFTTSGTIVQLNVQAGDAVKTGQVLAVLDTIPSLKQAVANKQLAVLTAQKTFDDLNSGAPAALASALSSLSAAQAALVTAQNNLHDPHDWRCPDNVTAAYYQEYLDQMVLARSWQNLMGNATESQLAYYQMHLKPSLIKMDQALMNYQYCQAYTQKEITQSQANLASAKANLDQAQAIYNKLKTNNGLDTTAVAIAQATLKNAQLQLVNAQNNLTGATLVSPYDGIVTAVSSAVGAASATTTTLATGLTVGTSPILTVAVVDPMQIQANIDETDLTNIGIGCQTSVSFSPLPGKSFTGTVSQISPTLVTVGGVKVAQILINLKSGALTATPLPIGTDANIQVTCSQAKGALLIPVQAIHEAADGSTFAYVLNAQSQPEKRAIVVGIRTSVAAEVKSGLKAGEQVITSPVNLP